MKTKNTILIILIGLFCNVQIFGSATSKIKAYLTYNTFYSPSEGSFFEIYLSVDANSLQYAKVGEAYKANVEITMILSSGEEIVAFKKYSIESPETTNLAAIKPTLFSQERIILPEGKYKFTLKMQDLNNKEALAEGSEEWIMPKYSGMMLSDILLVESYTQSKPNSTTSKGDIEIIPHQDNFYPQSDKKITTYAELYNIKSSVDKGETLLAYSGIKAENSGSFLQQFVSQKRINANEVTIIFNSFDITDLPTGNYFYTIEIKNKQNELVTEKSMFFQRYNTESKALLSDVFIQQSEFSKITQKDSLTFFIRSLIPVAEMHEKIFINNQLKVSSIEEMQIFLGNFWAKRSKDNPYEAWLNYKKVVLAVESEFATQTRHGFDTDRGRIYLQYGTPDQRNQKRDNPLSMPYEIWQYYNVKNQSNVRFVFIARSLAHDFLLEHSTAEGEIKNPDWQDYLFRTQQSRRSDDPDRYNRADRSRVFGEDSGETFD